MDDVGLPLDDVIPPRRRDICVSESLHKMNCSKGLTNRLGNGYGMDRMVFACLCELYSH